MAEYIGLVSTLVSIVRVFVCERMLHPTATTYRQMYWDWTISHEFTICCIFFLQNTHTHTHIFSLSSNASKCIRWLYFSPRNDDKTKQKKSLRALHFGKSTEKLLRIWLSRMKNKTIAFANLKCLDNKDSMPDRVIRSLVIFRYVCTSDLLLLSIFSIV